MYSIHVASKRVEKILNAYLVLRDNIKERLDKLRENPRKNCGAHPLRGKLKGDWACWLGSNIRAIYSIDEIKKEIIIEAVGTHKVY